MMKRSSLIKIAAVTLLVLAAFFLLLSYLLNTGYLSRRLKPFLTERLEKALKKKVELERISYIPPLTLRVENLSLRETLSAASPEFLSIEEGVFRIFYLPAYGLNITGAVRGLELRKRPYLLVGKVDISARVKKRKGEKEKVYYRGRIKIDEVEITGLPEIGGIKSSGGVILFTPEYFLAKRLEVNLLDSLLLIEGKVANPSEPEVDLKISPRGTLDLATISALTSALKDFDVKGGLAGNVAVVGKVSELPNLKVSGEFSLKDAGITHQRSGETLEKIEGMITFEGDAAVIPGLKVYHRKREYNLSGKIANFTEPLFNLDIVSGEIFCSLAGNFKKPTLNLERIEVTCLDSSLNLAAAMEGYRKKTITASGEAKLVLEQLVKFFPELEKLNPAGTLTLTISAQGNPEEWREAQIDIKGVSSLLRYQEIGLSNFTLDLDVKDKRLDINELRARAYGGELFGRAEVELSREPFSYSSHLRVSNIDLKMLTRDTKLAEKDISGRLEARLDLWGPDLAGKGWVKMAEGKLWEVPIFTGLANIFGLSAKEKIVFESAEGNFEIKDERINTQDFLLSSKDLTLKVSGAVGFDKKLDLLVEASFSEDFYQRLQPAGPFGGGLAVLGELTNKYVAGIKITGTLDKPQYKIVPRLPGELLRDIIAPRIPESEPEKKPEELLPGIFEEIFKRIPGRSD